MRFFKKPSSAAEVLLLAMLSFVRDTLADPINGHHTSEAPENDDPAHVGAGGYTLVLLIPMLFWCCMTILKSCEQHPDHWGCGSDREALARDDWGPYYGTMGRQDAAQEDVAAKAETVIHINNDNLNNHSDETSDNEENVDSPRPGM